MTNIKNFLMKRIGINSIPPNFTYAKCSTCSEKTRIRYLCKKTKGFFTEYSKSTASEDMAEVYSHLIYFRA